MRWYWSPAGALIAVASALFCAFGWYVWRRSRTPASLSLTIAMLAAGWWSLAYSLELSGADLQTIQFWGDAKYVGIVLLAPSWAIFTLQYTDRQRMITPWLLAGLAVMPVLTLALLANSTTHDLIRFYLPLDPGQELPSAHVGPLFWVHLVYSYALLVGGTILLALTFLRLSRFYRSQSIVLLLAATLPLAGNLLYNLRVDPFKHFDPTPFAFLVCGGVLIWGLLRFGMLELVPIARDTIIERMSDSVIVLDVHRRIVDLNPAAEHLLGCGAATAVGRPAGHLLPRCADLLNRHGSMGDAQTELRVTRSGPPRDYDVALTTINDPHGRPAGHLLVLRDVTERKLSEQRLSRLAHYDTLTGMPNRQLFSDRLEEALSRARRRLRPLALLFCDVDRFKRVNDTLGHDIGDQALCQIAGRLKDVLREEDTIARLGGDEFVILLPEVERSADAELVAHLLVQALNVPLRVGQGNLYLTMSVGVCLYPQDGLDGATLMRHADATMYRAKDHGRNRYELHSPESDERLLEELQLEQDLRGARQRGELEVWYQPAACLDTRALIGMEGLVRWRHPQRGLLMPAQFLPVVEESDLIQELDRWVLREACRQALHWQAQERQSVPVMVNLSARQFQDPGLREEVARTLWETGLTPANLILEVAETVIMRTPEASRQRLGELKRLGVRLAADDFGAGTALLARLREFPLDLVKIARSLVLSLERHDRDGAHLGGMIQIGRDLGVTVVAKGVDNGAQCAVLKRLGCEAGQGFLFAKPLPLSAAGRYLASTKPSRV